MVLKLYRRIKKALEEFQDIKLNRELVGIDKFGNKYYQYFSYYGLPTRREVKTNSMENEKEALFVLGLNVLSFVLKKRQLAGKKGRVCE